MSVLVEGLLRYCLSPLTLQCRLDVEPRETTYRNEPQDVGGQYVESVHERRLCKSPDLHKLH